MVSNTSLFFKIDEALIQEKFDNEFWKLFKNLSDDEATFNFLFEKEEESYSRFFKICLAVDYGSLSLNEGCSFNFMEVISNFAFMVSSSKHLSNEDKLNIVTFSENNLNSSGELISPITKKARSPFILGETIWYLKTKATFSDDVFNKFLKSDWVTLIGNENLPLSQHTMLVKHALNLNNNNLSENVILNFRVYKPEHVKLELDANWLVLKTCFNLKEKSNVQTLNALLKDVDVDTFKALEVSWSGTLGDLIEASVFNGPDKTVKL